jgi:hypothetical protein
MRKGAAMDGRDRAIVAAVPGTDVRDRVILANIVWLDQVSNERRRTVPVSNGYVDHTITPLTWGNGG